MRLIDADAIDTRYSDPEVVETLDGAPTVDAVPVDMIKKAILEMKKLQRQEDMGIGYYNPPFYCERCIMILEAFIEGGKE
jgi:hypothetical protein